MPGAGVTSCDSGLLAVVAAAVLRLALGLLRAGLAGLRALAGLALRLLRAAGLLRALLLAGAGVLAVAVRVAGACESVGRTEQGQGKDEREQRLLHGFLHNAGAPR